MATASKSLALAAIGLGIAGCAPVAPSMGEAYRYDMAIQTVNPEPVYPADAAEPGSNGDTARAAAERYRKGTVKPIERQSTNVAAGEGGGGGASGGGGK